MFSSATVFFLCLPVAVDGHGFLKRYAQCHCMHQDSKWRFSDHSLSFLILLCPIVQDQEIMLPTSHHGGQLTRTPPNRKAGEIVSRVYFQYFYFIAHVLSVTFLLIIIARSVSTRVVLGRFVEWYLIKAMTSLCLASTHLCELELCMDYPFIFNH